MIRQAELKDLDVCIDLAIEFFKPFLDKHHIPLNKEDLRKTAEQSIIAQKALVIEHNKEVQGVASWFVTNHPANFGIKIFYETIWCIKSNFKTDVLLLLRALEAKAKEVNADLILIANLSNERENQLRRIFCKRGFSFLETHYSKKIGD